MKIYILDDDKNTCRKLSQIIEEENLGNIMNFSQDPIKTLNDFVYFDVDIMIIDLLMPKLDGINFVKKAKEINSMIEFVMISQVNNKEMISKAYNAGVRFFINKPINRIEVKHVIENLSEVIEYRTKFNYLSQVFNQINNKNTGIEITMKERIKKTLIELGIWGEKGSDEIIELAQFIKLKNINFVNVSVREVIEIISDNPKNFEQRVRRAIWKGLSNLAYIGLEDYLNNTFVEYSNTLYDFGSIQKEMEYLRGNSDKGGKVSLKKFIDNLINI